MRPVARMIPRMPIDRRGFLVVAAASVASVVAAPALPASRPRRADMYGLIGRMTAAPGQRDALIAILLEGIGEMPGCLSYVVARDPADADAIWITEAWESQERHAASLTLPVVRQAIARARPLIAGFGESTVTAPVGGHGLVPTPAR